MTLYLEELREKIENKQLNDFWIYLENKKFKPMNTTKDDLLEEINDNLDKYVDKRFAHIKIGIKKNINNYDENHESVFTIRIVIYVITNKGKFSRSDEYTWGCLIRYDLFDILDRKFNLEDLKKIINYVNLDILVSDGLSGISYKTMLNRLNKKNVDF